MVTLGICLVCIYLLNAISLQYILGSWNPQHWSHPIHPTRKLIQWVLNNKTIFQRFNHFHITDSTIIGWLYEVLVLLFPTTLPSFTEYFGWLTYSSFCLKFSNLGNNFFGLPDDTSKCFRSDGVVKILFPWQHSSFPLLSSFFPFRTWLAFIHKLTQVSMKSKYHDLMIFQLFIFL